MLGTITPSLGDVYKYVTRNAHLDEYLVAKSSPTFGNISFIELDLSSRQFVQPILNDLDETERLKGEFLLDICLLNLMRQGQDLDPARMAAVDIHYNTLCKVPLRTKYLTTLSEFVKANDRRVLVNVIDLPLSTHVNHVSDHLRYLMPVTKDVSIQLNEDYILSHDLTRIAARAFVLTITELSKINNSARKDAVLGRLAKAAKQGKEVIARNNTELSAKSDIAFYL